jgi:NADPH-dependent glutamate synthase beta subunit-like oxidoreductase
MDFLRPDNLLKFGYKDCLLCEVDRKGEEKRCMRCSGKAGQRDRLLWEIHRAWVLRRAARLSLLYPGLGHLHDGRYAAAVFWGSLLPLALVPVLAAWRGPAPGHLFLLLASGLVWYFAWLDAGRGPSETVAPCRSACPAGINVPDYIALVREERPVASLALVHDRLPFAAFCGRACPHPCERECVRSEFGAPISIMAIKRYAADLGYGAGILPFPGDGDGTPGPKVAVVGAGPAGLSAADTLARLGSRVTVFDESEEPGGMMRYGVADFRFPREALLGDLRTILARGVRFEGGKTFGREVTLETLEADGFEGVLLAVGAGEPWRLPGSGGEREGFFDAPSYLSRAKRGRPVTVTGRVAVIGGGNVAVDAARVAVRLGAGEVTIACLESPDELSAHRREVEDAVGEGVKVLAGTGVKRFLYRDGRVAGLEAVRVERIARDAEGRILPRTVPGSEFEVGADAVITAVGSRPGLDPSALGASAEAVDSGRGVSRLLFRDARPRIVAFACGDCVTGPSTVVEASAAGRAAALNIYGELRVEEVRKARFRDNYRRAAEPQVPDRPEWRTRREAPRLPPQESGRTFEEVRKRYDADCVRRESERCARCNLSL